VTRDRPSADRPLPERLPLGAASRLLGVDPDTLRRWADEGRVPAFTTPGGHRRFEREALERLIAARRTGPAGALSGVGSTPDRLSAAYRRRYSDPRTPGGDPQARVPDAERETFRDTGRRLVDALVRHLDETGQARALAERDAIDLAAHLGERLALHSVPLADAVSMFVSARRPFLAELSVVARMRGVDPARIGDLFDSSTWLLDRLLLAFVAGHEVVSREAALARRAATRAKGQPAGGEDAGGGREGGDATGGGAGATVARDAGAEARGSRRPPR
jgi:excisionase family DNA binding protein